MDSKAYSEVYQLIQYLPENEYKCIPKWQIEYLRKNMNKNIGKIFSININILEVEISLEAKTILLSLYYLYIANDEMKDKIEKILYREEQKRLNEKRDQFKVFEKKREVKEDNKKIIQEPKRDTELIVIEKNSIWYKIKKFFSSFF